MVANFDPFLWSTSLKVDDLLILAVADIWVFLLTPPGQLLHPFVKPPNISHLPTSGLGVTQKQVRRIDAQIHVRFGCCD